MEESDNMVMNKKAWIARDYVIAILFFSAIIKVAILKFILEFQFITILIIQFSIKKYN